MISIMIISISLIVAEAVVRVSRELSERGVSPDGTVHGWTARQPPGLSHSVAHYVIVVRVEYDTLDDYVVLYCYVI